MNINNRFKRIIFLMPIFGFFVIYLILLVRSYTDVAYMDQVQILAGNINHMYNNDSSILDFYYRPPFLLFFSTILVFLNCKLFFYNTYLENIISGIILLLIALYYFKSNYNFFTKRSKFYFSILVGLTVFCFIKWEMSLWGGGFSHYMVVLLGFICTNLAHKYYLSDETTRFSHKYFLPLYISLAAISILETTSYFLPFLVSIIILLLINYKFFRSEINFKKWRLVLVTTIVLIIFSFLINYAAELYSIHYTYEAYGKVNLSQSLGESFKKIYEAPLFVFKFFFISISGSLVDKDSYLSSTIMFKSMPFIGFGILLLYCYTIFLFIKKRRIEGVFSISLIIYTIIFSGTVLLGRMGFNDVYYGGSSRYSAATFSGILGLSTFFLLLLNRNDDFSYKRLVYLFSLAIIAFLLILVNRNQWYIAPYRKQNFSKMKENLKTNKGLEALMGYNNDIAGAAREVMIRNKINVFKPQVKLEKYIFDCENSVQDTIGFYKAEKDQFGPFRWTNGNAVALLPNLYTVKDTVKAILKCYLPQVDTPKVILNDNLTPFRVSAIEGGYEYYYAFQEQKVLFKALILNKAYVPNEINKNSPDTRTLGLIFRSLILYSQDKY